MATGYFSLVIDDQCTIFVGIPGGFVARLIVETAFAACLLVWCLRTRRDGVWAVATIVAASCWTAVAALNCAANLWARGSADDLFWWTVAQGDALDWVRLLSIGGVVLTLTATRTRRSEPVDA